MTDENDEMTATVAAGPGSRLHERHATPHKPTQKRGQLVSWDWSGRIRTCHTSPLSTDARRDTPTGLDSYLACQGYQLPIHVENVNQRERSGRLDTFIAENTFCGVVFHQLGLISLVVLISLTTKRHGLLPSAAFGRVVVASRQFGPGL